MDTETHLFMQQLVGSTVVLMSIAWLALACERGRYVEAVNVLIHGGEHKADDGNPLRDGREIRE